MYSWEGLDVFNAIAQTGSFTRAAKTLNVSLSFVSRQMALLEEQIGTRLLVRTTRKVELTQAGLQFHDRCERLLAERDAAIASVQSSQKALAGPLRVTCSVAFGAQKIMPLLNEFAARHPDVSLEIDATNRLVDLMRDGFDLAVRTGDFPKDTRLTYEKLGARSLHVCAAPAYLARNAKVKRLDDLKMHTCLIGSVDHWEFRYQGRKRTLRLRSNWRCNNGFGVLDAAIKGLGICQLPDFFCTQAIESGDLVELLEDFAPDPQPIWGVYPAKTHNQDRINALVDTLKAGLLK